MDRIVTNQADADKAETGHQSGRRITALSARTLGVSKSGYYDWKRRLPSARTVENKALSEAIAQAYVESEEIYGAKKLQAELRDADVAGHDVRWAGVGKNRVARLMRAQGLRGISRRRAFTVTTERSKTNRERPAPDLVERRFVADAPNRLWVADITYVPTWAGFVYLAIVLDAWSRRVVGWQIGETLHTQLVLDALNMALLTRKPESVIHHSDQGCQYTSLAFGGRCQELGVRPSMGTVGDAYDNAMAESFFASLEHELLARRSFKTKAEAKTALFTYIEAWYNLRRRHSGIEYLSPTRFETKYAMHFEQRVTHNPAPVSLKGQHERGVVDNPARIEIEASDSIIDTSPTLEFLQP